MQKNIPYMLCIRTNDFVAEYAEKLVSFVIGISSKTDGEDYGDPFIRAFWNNREATDINDYGDYLARLEVAMPRDVSKDILSRLDMAVKTDPDALPAVFTKPFNKYTELYDITLCETDALAEWETDENNGPSIYGVGRYFGESDDDCIVDSIYIHLNKPLEGDMEKMIIGRIIYFFRNDVYDTLSKCDLIRLGEETKLDYECHLCDTDLISIELIDADGNVVKEYEVHESLWRYDTCGLWRNGEKVFGNHKTLAVAVDDNMGISFNKRVCSKDSFIETRMEILNGGRVIRTAPTHKDDYTVKEYWEPKLVSEETGIYIAGYEDPTPLLNHFGEVIVFKWNREYPSDVKFTADLSKDYILVQTNEFVGTSHEKITEERYVRKNN